MLIKTMFLMTLVMGTLVTISATNWISAWVGLELNLLSFVPLMFTPTESSTEATLKYFLTQTLGSVFLIFSMVVLSMFNLPLISQITSFMFLMALALKMGAAPLHFWLPAIMQGLSWLNCLILMTWQKLAPLFMIMMLKSPLISVLIVASALVGGMGGYNQMLMRKVLAYSSINHMSWLITTTLMSQNMVIIYFMIYSILNTIIIIMSNKWNIIHITQIPTNKSSNNIYLLMCTNLLSLGGIPPFLGFLPKWIIISQMMPEMPIQISIMTMSTLLSLYFYLRITYTLLLKSPSSFSLTSWSNSKMMSWLTLMSSGTLLIIAPFM